MQKLKALTLGATIAASVLIAGCGKSVQAPDLDRVLDVTADTLYAFEPTAQAVGEEKAPAAFAKELESNMNSANPKVHAEPIGIAMKEDGSIAGFNDVNQNSTQDSGEKDLFTVEIDSEKNRLIATDSTGTSRDHRFSGTSLLAGMLLGSLLSRQRAAGVNSKSLANKKTTSKSAYQNARSRAGSGSHSRGK